jgi:hypothetical protein
MEDEFIERISKSLEKSLELTKRTDFLNKNYLNEAVKIVNAIITNPIYNNNQTIGLGDIEFTDSTFGARMTVADRKETIEANGDTVIDIQFNHLKKLTQILFDIYYPKANEKSYYHYTKLSSLRKILKGELTLKPLISYANDDEFKHFYQDHDILGYFHNKDDNGAFMIDSLMKEIYVFCMASKLNLNEKNENALWRSCADRGGGVRIEFEVAASHPDFRKIFYKDKDYDKRDLVLNRLQSVVNNLYERKLHIPGISKIGAFYLPGDYKIENEVRFMVKKHTDEYGFHYSDDKGYLTIPLKNEYAEFKIKKIKIGERCSEQTISDIRLLILENGYSEEIIEV